MIIRCIRCGGTGRLVLDKERQTSQTCPICKGTGKIDPASMDFTKTIKEMSRKPQ